MKRHIHHLVKHKENLFAFLQDFRKDWKHTSKKTVRRHRHKFAYLIVIALTCILLVPFATYIYFAKDLKDKDSIMNRSKTGLTLLDRNGKPFFTFYQPKKITYVPLNEIPLTMQQAVVAAEDQDFYKNPGFSYRGMARALLTDLVAGRIVEGGSTITQELVKNALLNQSRNFLRKYQEVVLAYELNRRYSKQDILEMYLNSVYFGEAILIESVKSIGNDYGFDPTRDLSAGNRLSLPITIGQTKEIHVTGIVETSTGWHFEFRGGENSVYAESPGTVRLLNLLSKLVGAGKLTSAVLQEVYESMKDAIPEHAQNISLKDLLEETITMNKRRSSLDKALMTNLNTLLQTFS